MTDPASALSRWEESWRLTGRPAPVRQLRTLTARYGERHRAYHDLRHILACLALAGAVRSQLQTAAQVELALWYHDAVYDPRAGDNEERSAALAVAELDALPEAARTAIAELIRATRHDAVPTEPDARFVVDIDLAILGAAPAAFDAYEAAIRREYRWVPRALYRRRRREILARLLDRPSLYSTPPFRTLLEAPARANLQRSLSRLS